MKHIQTKSFSDPKKPSDGLRICVMRRFKPEYDFDCWFPVLAPTEELLTAYVKEKRITWKEFSQRYKKEVLSKQKKMILSLVKLSEITTVTLLCWEKSEQYCHRKLIKEACLEVKIKQ